MGYDLTGGGYYLVIPAPVAEDTHLRERSKLIYGRITQLAAATGYCYASNKALLEILSYEDPQTGVLSQITERTLQSSLAELRERGHISMDTGPVPTQDGTGTVIRRRIFIGQRLAENPAPSGGEENFTPEKTFTPGVKKFSPPYNSKNNTSKNKPPVSPIPVLDAIDAYIGDDPEYRAAFLGFLENRALMKKPVKTTRAISGIINRLRKVNQRETEIAMLDKATLHNWLSVFPLKEDELPATGAHVPPEEEVTYI